jgi:hypothetical protein
MQPPEWTKRFRRRPIGVVASEKAFGEQPSPRWQPTKARRSEPERPRGGRMAPRLRS